MKSKYVKNLFYLLGSLFFIQVATVACFKKKTPSDVYTERHPWQFQAHAYTTVMLLALEAEFKNRAEYFFSKQYKGCSSIYLEKKLHQCTKGDEQCVSKTQKTFSDELRKALEAEEKSKEFFNQCDAIVLENVKEMKDLGMDKELGVEINIPKLE